MLRGWGWYDSQALGRPCCAGTPPLCESSDKLEQLNCFTFICFSGLVQWREYTEHFSCPSLDIFCFVMLMMFLLNLFSQHILAHTMLNFAPGGLFGSGASTASLGSKSGFFWSTGVHLHLFTVAPLPLSLFVLRYNSGCSCTCPVLVWCPKADTSVSL